MVRSPKSLERFGLTALGDFIPHGRWVAVEKWCWPLFFIIESYKEWYCKRSQKLCQTWLCNWLSHFKKNMVKRHFTTRFSFFSILCLGEYVTRHTAISYCQLIFEENIVYKEDNREGNYYVLDQKGKKRTNMVISVLKSLKRTSLVVQRFRLCSPIADGTN